MDLLREKTKPDMWSKRWNEHGQEIDGDVMGKAVGHKGSKGGSSSKCSSSLFELLRRFSPFTHIVIILPHSRDSRYRCFF